MIKYPGSMRLMEFIVDYVHLSKAEPGDETCITFRYLDYFKINVKQCEYETSRNTKSKNCLFTMHDNLKYEENHIDIEVFKLPSCAHECTTKIGVGTIHLDSTFKKSFAVTSSRVPSVVSSNTSLQVDYADGKYPITENEKIVVPILNNENVSIGSVGVHVTVTSFGPSLIYQSALSALGECPGRPTIDRLSTCDECLKSDDPKLLSPALSSCPCDTIGSIRPMNESVDLQLTPPNVNHNENEFPLVPPSSKHHIAAPESEFEEFCAEVNDNVLIVRVAKANRKVTRICEDIDAAEEGKTFKCQLRNLNMICSDDGENLIVEVPNVRGKYTNSCGIPAIKGNLKYPARFCSTFKLPSCTDMEKKHILRTSNICLPCNKTVTDSFSACPIGVEVCKKGSDSPNCDVFVVKLGQVHGTHNEIELELQTPKSPTADMPVLTEATQTYEEDFNEAYNGNKPGKSSGKKGKK